MVRPRFGSFGASNGSFARTASLNRGVDSGSLASSRFGSNASLQSMSPDGTLGPMGGQRAMTFSGRSSVESLPGYGEALRTQAVAPETLIEYGVLNDGVPELRSLARAEGNFTTRAGDLPRPRIRPRLPPRQDEDMLGR